MNQRTGTRMFPNFCIRLILIRISMIPFKKIFTLFIRTFSRPMLEYFKQQHRLKHQGIFGRVFVSFGRNIFVMEHWVNHRVLRSHKHFKKVQYKEEVLLEKGIETFSQILMYLVILGIPFWEMYKGTLAAHHEEQRLQRRLTSLDKKLELVNQKISRVSDSLTKGHKIAISKQQLESKEELGLGGEVGEKKEEVGVEELIENAIDVVAEQFEDSLDDFTLAASSQPEPVSNLQQNIEPSTVETETMSSEPLEFGQNIQMEIVVIEPAVETE